MKMSWVMLFLVFTACEMPKNVPFQANFKEIAVQLSGRDSASIRTDQDARAALDRLDYRSDPKLELWTENFWRDLREKNEKFGTVIEDKVIRYPMYCPEVCTCIWDRFTKALLSARAGGLYPELYSLYIRGPGSLGVGVRMGRTVANYHFHYSQILKSKSGAWFVFDPTVFGDGKLHSVKEFVARLVNPETLRITAVRK